jgi:hypothetical protein
MREFLLLFLFMGETIAPTLPSDESGFVDVYMASQGSAYTFPFKAHCRTAKQCVSVALALDPEADSVERIRVMQAFIGFDNPLQEIREALEEILATTKASCAFHHLIMRGGSVVQISATLGETDRDALDRKVIIWKKFCVEPLKLYLMQKGTLGPAKLPCEPGELNEWVLTSNGRAALYSSLARNEVVL